MSQARSNPPFRAEHIGSLLRPKYLTQAYRAFTGGSLSAIEFRKIQDRAVSEAVSLQEQVGFQSITDGEFRRTSYWAHFVEAVEGLSVKAATFKFHDYTGDDTEFLAPHVHGRVRRTRSVSGEEFDYLRSVTRHRPKLTMPSPPTMHFWRGREGVEPSAYQSDAEYFADLARVYNDEIRDLAARGLRYLQIDEVPLAMLCDPRVQEVVKSKGGNPDSLVQTYVELINASLAERPEEMTVGMHLCRGNFKGKWLAEGGYEALAEKLFGQVDVDVFLLEYDTPRAGDFHPLRFLPETKGAVLGLITTKKGELEEIDFLRRRIDEASRFVPPERLSISPQCGFSSTVAANPITVDDQKRKLELVVEVARVVWG